jgi:protein gp37
MGKHSAIEWTDHTFNPWWGCVKVSPACSNCYAETWAKRVGQNLWGSEAPRRFFSDQHWKSPIAWNRECEKDGIRRRVFCASMADVFEKRSDLDASRERLWELISKTPLLDWLLLSKRPEEILSHVPWGSDWPANVWIGATIESQEWAHRAESLVQIPAKIRFLSCEPLVGPLDLSPWLDRIHWVIVGGESGARARPLNPEWIHSLLKQAEAAKTVFHFKQWGEWSPSENSVMKRVGKKNAGRQFMGKTWDGFPTVSKKAEAAQEFLSARSHDRKPAP